ncbi:MAG: COX15/CtaA family protein [Porticoccaceae bacterium]|nr:COX15/CtaA family protein [Porticoccaceae bacterium]
MRDSRKTLIEKRFARAYRLALLATVVAATVVVLGAFTRLVDAGLGCPDWPGCYGHLMWPDEAHEIARAEERFPDAVVEPDKTWPEMVHRYFASSLGLIIICLAVLAWRNRDTKRFPFRLPLLLLFLVVWQGLFGMWTVTLKLWPQVVTLHLLGGVSIFSLIWLLALRLRDQPWVLTASSWHKLNTFKPWLIAGVIILFMQIALGGWLSSNYGAFACGDFPRCQEQWLPSMNLSEGFNILQSVGPNYLGGLMTSEARVAIHWIHRVGALVTFLYLSGFCLALFFVGDRRVNRMAIIIFGMLLVQVGLGISNVLLAIPLLVAVLHNAGASLLMLSLVTLGVKIWIATKPVEEISDD